MHSVWWKIMLSFPNFSWHPLGRFSHLNCILSKSNNDSKILQCPPSTKGLLQEHFSFSLTSLQSWQTVWPCTHLYQWCFPAMTPFWQIKHFNSSCKTLLKSDFAYFAADDILQNIELSSFNFQLSKLSYPKTEQVYAPKFKPSFEIRKKSSNWRNEKFF